MRCLTLHLALLLGLLAGTSPASSEELACSTKRRFKDGSSAGAALSLSVPNDRVTALRFSNFVSSGTPGGAYSCHVDTGAADAKVRWKRKATATEVTIGHKPEEQSIVIVHKTADGYRVSFESMWSGHCGFGAEFPQHVELRRGQRQCKVSD